MKAHGQRAGAATKLLQVGYVLRLVVAHRSDEMQLPALEPRAQELAETIDHHRMLLLVPTDEEASDREDDGPFPRGW